MSLVPIIWIAIPADKGLVCTIREITFEPSFRLYVCPKFLPKVCGNLTMVYMLISLCVNGLAIWLFQNAFSTFQLSSLSLAANDILSQRLFIFSAHTGVSAVQQNPHSEFRLVSSIYYDYGKFLLT